MGFKHQDGVRFELDQALESGNLYWAIHGWLERMHIAVRQDLLEEGAGLNEWALREYIRTEVAYEALIESLLVTIESLRTMLAESNVRERGKDAEAHVEKEGLR